jgi:hypothetical protein
VTTLKLAWRLAYSRDARQRWRQVSVVLATFAATAIALLAVGIASLAHESDARIAGRQPVWAVDTQGSAIPGAILRISARALTTKQFGQFPVVWLEPLPGHEGDPGTVPPGLSRLPAPGEGVLSQGLVEQGLRAEDFGLKSSSAGVGAQGAIGQVGLSTLSEGWIYARPAPGRSLGEDGAVLLSKGYLSNGEGISLETIPEVPTSGATRVGVAWMLLAPAAFLLLSAARAMSGVRDARAQTLWRLGVASRRIRALLAAETALLALAGALPALALWVLVLNRATTVPLTVATLKTGALAFPLWMAVATILGTVALAAFAAVVGRIRDRSIRRDARTVRSWHAAPLVLAFLMMGIGPWLPPTSQLRQGLLFAGLLLTFVALPMALPTVVAHVGSLLGRSGRPAVWLAGRRLKLRSANLARPGAMVGALVFVAGAAFAIYDHLVASENNVGSNAAFSTFTVSWRDGKPTDLATARALAPNFTVLAVASDNNVGPGPDGSMIPPKVYFHDCAELARWADRVPLPACNAAGEVTAQATNYFQTLTRSTPVIGAPPDAAQNDVFILAAKGTSSQDVMKALATLPAVNINQIGGLSKVRDPQAGWMLAGWTLATALLAVALIREIGDRGLASMQDVSHLLRLGLRRREIETSYRWSLLPPVAVAIPIGFVGAVLFALLGYELGFTVNDLARIGAVAVIAALVSVATFSVVFAIQRRTSGLTD